MSKQTNGDLLESIGESRTLWAARTVLYFMYGSWVNSLPDLHARDPNFVGWPKRKVPDTSWLERALS